MLKKAFKRIGKFSNEYEHLLDEKDKLRLKTNPLRVLDTKI